MNNRTLGTIAMICAPAMLIEALTPNGSDIPFIVGTASMIFMAGSFSSHIGLWRAAATGRGWWGRSVLAIQLTLVALAFIFGFFEATGLVGEENILFTITDMSWPISMIFMLAVGITTAVVGRLPGWRRFVPLICGLALPLTIILTIVTGADMQGDAMGFVFFGMLTAFWMLLGFVVCQSEDVVESSPVAVRQLA